MRYALFLLAAFASLAGCREARDELVDTTIDNFMFSQYGCMCAGSCISGYRLTSEGLYKGVGTWCDPSTLVFETTSQSATDVALAQDLQALLPLEMLQSTADVYGCPDCGDWGGYYVEITQNGSTRHWRLDTQVDTLPPSIKLFAIKVRETLDALN